MLVDTPWLSIVTFLLIAFTLLYSYVTRKFNYWKKRNIQYVEPTPFIGNLLPLFGMKETFGVWMRELSYKCNNDYFGVFMVDEPALIVQSPKLIKTILQKDFSHFEDRTVANAEKDPICSNFLFLMKNPKWKAVRGKLSPVFTSGKLKLMFPLMLDESKAMSDYISGLVNIPNVEAKEICAKYSTNVIAKCAFGVNANCFQNEEAEFRKLGRVMFEPRLSNQLRQMGAWIAPKIFNFFTVRFFDPKTLTGLTNIFTDVLHSRIKSNFLKGQDLIDILLETRENNKSDFEELTLVGQAIQFFVGGFETVSNALGFSLYELCLHPDIQTKLRAEIFDNIKNHNGITYEGVLEMKYLDMCVSETLRKYPAVPFIDRKCKADYKVENSDFVIEKGISVFIPLLRLHNNPKVFPNPEKFDPERFADKANFNNDGFNYLPFGEGPRMCIGNRFGLMDVKLGLIAVLSKFKLEATDKTPIPIKFAPKSVVLQSAGGFPLKFVPI